MTTFIIRRLLFSIPVLVAASMLIFFSISIAGDPLGELRTRPNIDEGTIERIAERKHLNDPIVTQYAYWVRDVFTNNFGTTTLSNQPIWPDLKRAMWNTMQLIVAAEVLAIVVAVAVGILSARKQYGAVRLRRHDAVIPRLFHAGVLAGADPSGAGCQLLGSHRDPHLLHGRPVFAGSPSARATVLRH